MPRVPVRRLSPREQLAEAYRSAGRRNKYNNRRAGKYDSQLEEDYANYLEFRRMAGQIAGWKRPHIVKFEGTGGIKYNCDFIEFENDGSTTWTEVKGGIETDLWKLKWALASHQYPDQKKQVARRDRRGNWFFRDK